MKLEDIKTSDDAQEYIGKSKSWLKGWKATVHKWKLISSRKRRYKKTSDCGLCMVAWNWKAATNVLIPMCEYCVLSDYSNKYPPCIPIVDMSAVKILEFLHEHRADIIKGKKIKRK